MPMRSRAEPRAPLVDCLIEDARWQDVGLEALAEVAGIAVLSRLGLPPAAYEISLLGCSDARIAEYKTEWARGGGRLGTMINWYRAGVRYPPSRVTDELTPPVHLVWGVDDPFLSPDMLEPSAKYCRQPMIHRIANASHWVHWDAPAAVIAILKKAVADALQ